MLKRRTTLRIKMPISYTLIDVLFIGAQITIFKNLSTITSIALYTYSLRLLRGKSVIKSIIISYYSQFRKGSAYASPYFRQRFDFIVQYQQQVLTYCSISFEISGYQYFLEKSANIQFLSKCPAKESLQYIRNSYACNTLFSKTQIDSLFI